MWRLVFAHYLLASCGWGVLTIAIHPTVLRLGFDRQRWLRTIVNYSLAGVAFSFLYFVLVQSLVRIWGLTTSGSIAHFEITPYRFIGTLQSNFIVFLVIASFCLAVNYLQKYQERELRASKLESQLTLARLDALKSQLQPHFLFNTLNSIAAQIRDHPAAAERMLVWLSDLLRATLENVDQDEVRLDEELRFAQRYLEIEAVRFADRLAVEMQIDNTVREALVPVVVLQPLVENAIWHGVAVSSAPCTVTIAAQRRDSTLCLRVTNTGQNQQTDFERPAGGVGLRNTRERLQHLYGDRCRFTAQALPAGGFEVRLEIPFRTETACSNPLE